MKFRDVLVIEDFDQLCDKLGDLIVEVENSDYPPYVARELLAFQGQIVAEKYLMDRAALEEKRQAVIKLLGE